MTLFINPFTYADPLPLFLIQVFIILVITRGLARLLKRFHQPPVIGEIIGGIILGPTVLGRAPGWTSHIFPEQSIKPLALVSNVGLIFFMFFMGLELDHKLLKKQMRLGAPIAFSAIAFPFLTGSLFSLYLHNEYSEDTVSRLAFTLFMGAAMSFTAFPVLASILQAHKLLADPLGLLAFACAAIDDVAAWCVLAIATSFSTSPSPAKGLYTTLISIAYVLFMIFAVNPFLTWVATKFEMEEGSTELNRSHTTIVFLVLMLSSYLSESIGIHAFFGAFIAGIIVPKQGNFVHVLAPKIEIIITNVLLPLFFAKSGLNLNLGAISGGHNIGVMFALIGFGCVGKFLPTCLVSKLTTKRSWRFCASLGILMNTRGLVELIVLNIGLDLKILPVELFSMMVVMAIVTTVLTPPLLYLLYVRPLAREAAAELDAPKLDDAGDSTLPTSTDVGTTGVGGDTSEYNNGYSGAMDAMNDITAHISDVAPEAVSVSVSFDASASQCASDADGSSVLPNAV